MGKPVVWVTPARPDRQTRRRSGRRARRSRRTPADAGARGRARGKHYSRWAPPTRAQGIRLLTNAHGRTGARTAAAYASRTHPPIASAAVRICDTARALPRQTGSVGGYG
eukprot:scaffold290_cov364-Prasinococcus_capsulatus_cf.AAC.6